MKTTNIQRKPRTRRNAGRGPDKRRPAKPLPIRRVLVPIDFSQPSRDALEFALPLLKGFGAELHLAHVVPPDSPLSGLADLPLVVPEIEIGRRVKTHLKDATRKFSVHLRRGNIHALKGRPFEEICRLAREIKIDLIITATRGLTGLKHLTLGSTAERVVRYSPCPVLVVRSRNGKSRKGRSGRSRTPFGRILVPIDFSDCSEKGLLYAINFARRFKSKLVLLHSIALQYYGTNDEYMSYDLPALIEWAEKAAHQQMHDLVQRTNWDGLQVDTSVPIGHAGEQICAGAGDAGADLIITSTHGTTGLKHVLLGSTAEYVVRHAHCPVLVVPSHEGRPLTKKSTRL